MLIQVCTKHKLEKLQNWGMSIKICCWWTMWSYTAHEEASQMLKEMVDGVTIEIKRRKFAVLENINIHVRLTMSCLNYILSMKKKWTSSSFSVLKVHYHLVMMCAI